MPVNERLDSVARYYARVAFHTTLFPFLPSLPIPHPFSLFFFFLQPDIVSQVQFVRCYGDIGHSNL